MDNVLLVIMEVVNVLKLIIILYALLLLVTNGLVLLIILNVLMLQVQ